MDTWILSDTLPKAVLQDNCSPPVLQLIEKRRAGGHGTSLKKSNLREDPTPLPFALISLPESERK